MAALVRIFDRLIMGRTGTPRGPLFIGNGLSDSIGDGVTVTKDVQEIAYTYCHRGKASSRHPGPARLSRVTAHGGFKPKPRARSGPGMTPMRVCAETPNASCPGAAAPSSDGPGYREKTLVRSAASIGCRGAAIAGARAAVLSGGL